MSDQRGGAAWESGRASERLAAAIVSQDPDAIRAAGSDLAASAGTAATSAMASIAATMLNEIKDLRGQLDRSDRADIDRRAELREHIDGRFDAYGAELDRIQREQKAASAQIVGHKDIALPGHGTDCPGDLWAVWKPRLLARVEAILAPSLGPTPDAPRPYRFRFPQVVFTAPDPIAPLAVGPTSGALLYIADAEVQIGEIKNGWAWIKTGPGRLDGPGFVPLSVLEAV